MPHTERSKGTVLRCGAILVVGVATILQAGCRTFQPPREAAAIPDQYHVVVDSFRISSSFALADDDPLARALVDLRTAVQATLHLSGSVRPTEVYIFEDRAHFEQFIQAYYPDLPRRRAFFIAQGQREMVCAFRDERLVEDLRHEACHALLHSSVGSIPLWLDEGLAEYFETPADAYGLHARHVVELQTALRQGWRPSLTRLEGFTHVRQMTARDYGEAWGWVYWLLHDVNEGRPLLLDYLQDIHAGDAVEPLSARLFAASARPDVAMVSLMVRL